MKRDVEAVKLRNELETRISTLEGYADRMDTKFGDRFIPGEDGRCDHSRITSPFSFTEFDITLVEILAPKSLKTFTTNSRDFPTHNQSTLKPKPSTCFRV